MKPKTYPPYFKLKVGLLYVSINSRAEFVLVGPDDAQVYDYRDNEEMKRQFAERILKQRVTIEILP